MKFMIMKLCVRTKKKGKNRRCKTGERGEGVLFTIRELGFGTGRKEQQGDEKSLHIF